MRLAPLSTAQDHNNHSQSVQPPSTRVHLIYWAASISTFLAANSLFKPPAPLLIIRTSRALLMGPSRWTGVSLDLSGSAAVPKQRHDHSPYQNLVLTMPSISAKLFLSKQFLLGLVMSKLSLYEIMISPDAADCPISLHSVKLNEKKLLQKAGCLAV